MADITKKAMNETYSGGIKTPSQMSTIAGPGVRLNNQYGVKKQSTLPVVGKKNK